MRYTVATRDNVKPKPKSTRRKRARRDEPEGEPEPDSCVEDDGGDVDLPTAEEIFAIALNYDSNDDFDLSSFLIEHPEPGASVTDAHRS